MIQRFAILLILSLSFSASAKKPSKEFSFLRETTSKYRSASVVKLSVEKIIKTELSGAKKSTGQIYLSGGLFRYENETPDKSLLVFDGSNLWNEQPASVDFPGKTQVSKQKVSKNNKTAIAFATLLTKESITDNFKIVTATAVDDQTVYEMKPLTNDVNIKSLTLKIRNKEKKVSEIDYTDDIDNVTEMVFVKTEFETEKNPKLFKYEPAKDAQVNPL